MAIAADVGTVQDLTRTWVGYASVAIFIIGYIAVALEEVIHLRKSKPMFLAAGIVWMLIGFYYAQAGDSATASNEFRHHLVDYAELLLFLLSAMTYINTMNERNVFRALRSKLVTAGYSLRTIYWITGVLAFFISPLADNLTTALIMAAVVLAVGPEHRAFVTVSCINIVVAANAGGAFSPFGDITTLMVWQRGILPFHEFFNLFVPAVVNWLVPAFLMSFVVPKVAPAPLSDVVRVKRGGFATIALFALTIAITVLIQHYLHLPPVLGMLTGLGILGFYSYWLQRTEARYQDPGVVVGNNGTARAIDIFDSMKQSEWDTLMFFYGVILCVGGLGTLGYLALVSHSLYGDLGATTANVLIGVISSVIDNIPVMFAVLNMNPDMHDGQWLLLTLTTGVGGSLLSIGSAAGVALMGQARGVYTFFSHLRWTWTVALGYAASIACHLWLNQGLL